MWGYELTARAKRSEVDESLDERKDTAYGVMFPSWPFGECKAQDTPYLPSVSLREWGRGQFLKELQTNTFSGSDHEDANEHIEKVLEIIDLFYILNITIDQVMLRAFPMSLTRAASRWLRNEPTGSITTWDGLKTKFLNKYCPPARTTKKIEEINNFQQEPDENLYQVWE
ncbi:putative reverse transcriptase domain-containing protein [Tanacetum coccineum]|uniref:Reverse transcriptase domain-containing protein n=1 Tax=Tanacetum coccineum TaxID=301880 RepID=A0ABQ5F481_9ASTR